MLSPSAQSLCEAAACLALAAPVQSAYCALRCVADAKRKDQAEAEGRADKIEVLAHKLAESRLRLQIIAFCAIICHFLGIILLLIGVFSYLSGFTRLADVMGLCCMGMVLLSTWTFEFIEVLLPFRYTTDWGESIILIGLIPSCAYVGVGIWLMIVNRLDILWAAAETTRIIIAAMMIHSVAKQQPLDTEELRPEKLREKTQRRRRLQLWAALAVFASILGFALCYLSAVDLLPAGHGPSQCIIDDIYLLPKAYLLRKICKQDVKQTQPRDSHIQRSNHRSSAGSRCGSSTDALIAEKDESTLDVERQLCSPGAAPEHVDAFKVGIPLSTLAPAHTLSISAPLDRSDSGVDLPSATPRMPSNTSSSSSTTTSTSEVYHQYEMGAMRFPAKPFSMFRVDDDAEKAYATMHAFCMGINKGVCVPKAVGQPKAVLDVGAGTPDWAWDVQSACPEAQVLCTDLYPLPSLLRVSGVTTFVEDANAADWGWDERFDWIRFGNIDGGIKDWGQTLKSAYDCQRAEGFLSLEQLIFYQPPGNLASDSIWHAWQRALDYIEGYSELSFALHDTQRVVDELQNAGYNIILTDKRFVQTRRGKHPIGDYDLSWSILELMKGIFARAWEIQPTTADKQQLLSLLEEECNRELNLKIITIIAQKPADIPSISCQ